MTPTPLPLKSPRAVQLTRAEDRLSFLYSEKCSVRQDDNGTKLVIGGPAGPRDAYLPTSSLGALILGPGTSITQPAVIALGRAGCSVSFVGSAAIRSYGTFLSPNAPTQLLQQQACVVADEKQRVTAVKRMFAKRFPDDGTISATVNDVSLEQLRGLEGIRMKAIYQAHARRHRLSRWRRNSGTDPAMGAPDGVNLALNYANTALYGVTNCVIGLLGLSPGLGLLHTGNRMSFALDIADLYKTEVTIPLAFKVGSSSNPELEMMRQLREQFRLLKLLPRIVDDIHEVLGVDAGSVDGEDWAVNDVYLWGDGDQSQLSRAGKA